MQDFDATAKPVFHLLADQYYSASYDITFLKASEIRLHLARILSKNETIYYETQLEISQDFTQDKMPIWQVACRESNNVSSVCNTLF